MIGIIQLWRLVVWAGAGAALVGTLAMSVGDLSEGAPASVLMIPLTMTCINALLWWLWWRRRNVDPEAEDILGLPYSTGWMLRPFAWGAGVVLILLMLTGLI